MAILRQANLLGSQRVDVPHIRAIESAVAGDFDLLAGSIIAGKRPLIVNGFQLLTTGITQSTALQLQTADSSLIHFFASESGSVFHVPADRANETLNSVNPRLVGSWTPSAVNYLGIDLRRQTDSTTTDLVQFIDPNTLLEDPKEVPLARTLDYTISITASDFDSNPSVCPLAIVTLDAFGGITSAIDARNFAFRLGSGGTNPDPQHSFGWVSGRNEAVIGGAFGGGDKSITSFKSWFDAVMTRLFEIGGGQYWYSATADRNVVLARSGSVFVSSGEYFEWSGSNLHWKGLSITFANSTGHINVIADQATDLAGLTDLLDGECLYVDIDRSQNRSGGSSLNAKKAPLSTLGDPATPGSRWVLAWRYGSNILTRDQSYPIGSSFKLATTAAAGNVELSATDSAGATPTKVATVDSVSFRAYAAGITRGNGTTNDFFGTPGDITIGGLGSWDHNVFLKTFRLQDTVRIEGAQNFTTGFNSPATIANIIPQSTDFGALTLRLIGFNDSAPREEDAHQFSTNGTIGWRNVLGGVPPTPAPTATQPIRSCTFFRDNGVASPNKRDQFCIIGWDGHIDVIWESNTY